MKQVRCIKCRKVLANKDEMKERCPRDMGSSHGVDYEGLLILEGRWSRESVHGFSRLVSRLNQAWQGSGERVASRVSASEGVGFAEEERALIRFRLLAS